MTGWGMGYLSFRCGSLYSSPAAHGRSSLQGIAAAGLLRLQNLDRKLRPGYFRQIFPLDIPLGASHELSASVLSASGRCLPARAPRRDGAADENARRESGARAAAAQR